MSVLRFPLVAAFLVFLAGLLPGLRLAPPALPFALCAGALAALALAGRPAFPHLPGGRLSAVGRRSTATEALTPRPPRPQAGEGGAVRRQPAAGSRQPGRGGEGRPLTLLAAALLLAGVALGGEAARASRADCRARLPDGAPLALRVVLSANLPPLARDARSPLLPTEAEGVWWRGRPLAGCMGGVRVRFPEGTPPLRAGSRLWLRGEWIQARAPVVASRWPRDPMYAGLLAADTVLAAAAPDFFRHPLLTLRGRAEQHLYELFPRHAALADALVLGRREALDPEVRERFARSGLVHLLAISGSHVALLGAALLLLGGVLRLPRRRVALGTIVLIALYLAVIGAPASAVRAGVMLSLALVGVLLQRPAATVVPITASAWVIVVLAPLALLDPGFQLSFAGVFGILAALRLQRAVRWPRGLRRAPLRWSAESLVISVATFAMTAPLVAYHFGQLAPVSIVANFPAVPLTGLAVLGVAAAALTEPLLGPPGRLLAEGAGAALDLLDAVAAWAAAVPGGHFGVPRPDGWKWAAALLALALAADAAARLRRPVRWGVAAGAAGGVLLVWPLAAGGRGAVLELYFLDVGQGDATAIRTPAGRWLLVDAGPRSEHSDAGVRRVLPFLRAQGARRVEMLFLTHPDADHVGGAAAVLRGIAVGEVVEPGLAAGKPLYAEALAEVERQGARWSVGRAGRSVSLDGVAFDVLWPDSAAVATAEQANEISLVLRLRYGAFELLLPGDVSSAVEDRLAERLGNHLRSEVLMAAHHGSATSTSAAWLDAVRPELVILSLGRRNRYGHPAPAVMARLHERGLRLARTDRDGTIRVRVELADPPRWRLTEP